MMRCVFLRSIGFCVLWPCMKVSAFRQTNPGNTALAVFSGFLFAFEFEDYDSTTTLAPSFQPALFAGHRVHYGHRFPQ